MPKAGKSAVELELPELTSSEEERKQGVLLADHSAWVHLTDKSSQIGKREIGVPKLPAVKDKRQKAAPYSKTKVSGSLVRADHSPYPHLMAASGP